MTIETDRNGIPLDPHAKLLFRSLRGLFFDVATDLGVTDFADEEFVQYAGDNQEDWAGPGEDPDTVSGVFRLVTGSEL